MPHQAHPRHVHTAGDDAAELAQAVHEARDNAVAAFVIIKWKK
jgi:hypothetical protein